jgi:hypothetical protein
MAKQFLKKKNAEYQNSSIDVSWRADASDVEQRDWKNSCNPYNRNKLRA